MESDIERKAEMNVAYFKTALEQSEYMYNKMEEELGENGDFSTHQHYLEYTRLIAERNRLAHVICKDSILHGPFVQEERLDWKFLESFAKVYTIEAIINAEYEKIPDYEREFFDNIAKYQQAKKEYEVLWQEVQKTGKKCNIINASVNQMIEDMQVKEAQQEMLALQIFDKYSEHEPFIALFEINVMQLHKQSYAYQIQQLVLDYDNTEKYRKCLSGWMEFEKIQGWSAINNVVNKRGLSLTEFKTKIFPTKLEELQKLTVNVYGVSIRLNTRFLLKKTMKIYC